MFGCPSAGWCQVGEAQSWAKTWLVEKVWASKRCSAPLDQLAVALATSSPLLLLQGSTGGQDGQIKLLHLALPLLGSFEDFPPEQPAAPQEGLKLPVHYIFFLHFKN